MSVWECVGQKAGEKAATDALLGVHTVCQALSWGLPDSCSQEAGEEQGRGMSLSNRSIRNYMQISKEAI